MLDTSTALAGIRLAELGYSSSDIAHALQISLAMAARFAGSAGENACHSREIKSHSQKFHYGKSGANVCGFLSVYAELLVDCPHVNQCSN